MDRSQIGILEERHKVSFGSLLECHHSRRLEAKIGLQESQTRSSEKRNIKFTLKS